MGMTPEEFARSIEDPYKMFSYIDTSLSYIEACKQSLEIRKQMLQMKRIDEVKFREDVMDALLKILNELITISIYTNSIPYQKEFLLLNKSEQAPGNLRENIYSRGFLNPELRPYSVKARVIELITEIREILNKESFAKALKKKDHKEILKILKHNVHVR